MKRHSKKYAHNLKLLKFFLFAQISTLIVATAIVAIVLIPNDFKQTHVAYQECLDSNKTLSVQDLNDKCPEPYTSE
ncbi:hypothetical protein KBD20_02415 [Candidatus Saccharibacteria bacterium]|nr:hypothetical protein [Candidatus Saccharibacteria bacterium]